MPQSKNKNLRTISLGILFFGISLTAASCSWFSKKKIEAKVPCPHVSVISDADFLARFEPNKKWTSKTILYEAKITGIKSACDFRDKAKKSAEKEKKGTKDKITSGSKNLIAAVSVSFATHINAKHAGRRAAFEYFVAITDRNANVLNKNVFRVVAPKPKKKKEKIKSPAKGEFVRFTDKPVRLKIPLKAGQRGHDYMVFVGFQLSKGQLELNRRRRRPPEEFGIKPPPEDTQGY